MDDKKVCLITGANSEIGSAIASRFKDEYKLVLCWHDSCSRLKELLPESTRELVQADLQHESKCRAVIEYYFEKHRKIDLLINCIGKNINVPDNEITEKDWDEVLSVNLKPAFFLCKYFQKNIRSYCVEHDKYSGCIINISSTAGIRALPSSPHYIAAKAGLIAVSKYYAKVLAPHVRVNTIAPGFVNTQKHTAPEYDALRAGIPMRRFAELSEIADTAVYLAGNKYITGQTIVVDGGMIS